MAKITLSSFLESLTHPRHRELADSILKGETLEQLSQRGFSKEIAQDMSDKIYWAKKGYPKPCYGCSIIRKAIGVMPKL
jgi:hypothetical protein